MSTARFDPTPDDEYGFCRTCGIRIQTVQDSNSHLTASLEEATAAGRSSGHTIRVLNPTRQSRIENEASDIIEEAISDAMSKFEDLVHRKDCTEDEIKDALRWHSDFEDAWEEYTSGG